MPRIIPRYIGVSELLASRFACRKDMKVQFLSNRLPNHTTCYPSASGLFLRSRFGLAGPGVKLSSRSELDSPSVPPPGVVQLSTGADWLCIPKTEGMLAAQITHPIFQTEGR